MILMCVLRTTNSIFFSALCLSAVCDMRCASCVGFRLNLRDFYCLDGEIRLSIEHPTSRRDIMNFTNEVKTCNSLNTA